MAEVPLQRQFAGQARLVRLLLWRIGDSTDIDACLQAATEAGMLAADDVAFLRECLDAEERQRTLGGAEAEAEAPAPAGLSIDEQLIARLRRCADKLNRADAA